MKMTMLCHETVSPEIPHRGPEARTQTEQSFEALLQQKQQEGSNERGEENPSEPMGQPNERSDSVRQELAAALMLMRSAMWEPVPSASTAPSTQSAVPTENLLTAQDYLGQTMVASNQQSPEMSFLTRGQPGISSPWCPQKGDTLPPSDATSFTSALQQVAQAGNTESETEIEFLFRQEQKSETGTGKQSAQLLHQQAPLFHYGQALPVKVAQGIMTTQQAVPQVAIGQVAEGLHSALEQGASRVELTLMPEALGKVSVEITRYEDGSIRVVLAAATEKTASVLSRHSAALQELLLGTNQAPVRVEMAHTAQQEVPLFFNPDESSRQQQQSQQQAQQQPERVAENTQDFMQQLRLGLFQLERTAG